MEHKRRNSLRSTVFEVPGKPRGETAKTAQERVVGDILATAYGEMTGTPLTGNQKPQNDPPDPMFNWRGIPIGAEMFELEAFYAERATAEILTNEIYREFFDRRIEDRYRGMFISLGVLLDVETAQRWKETNVARGKGPRELAREVADLVTGRFPSAEALPNTDLGSVLRVDPAEYEVLSRVTKHVFCSRCPAEDPRRSDGQAVPLVIVSPGIDYSDEEMVGRATQAIRRKIEKKASGSSQEAWSSSDHTLLVAHDLPRGRFYQGFGKEWRERLREAADASLVLESFDELWLVTFQSLGGEATRICGATPSPAV